MTWNGIISIYSETQFSRSSDRLLSLQGIIDGLERKWNDEAIFGLWTRSLSEQLCWKVKEGVQVELNTSSEWLAPSWSWASISKPVTWCMDPLGWNTDECFIAIQQCENVKPGSLFMKGRLMPFESFDCPRWAIHLAFFDWNDPPIEEGKLYYLPVHSAVSIWSHPSLRILPSKEIYGLIVMPQNTTGKEYVRVGAFAIINGTPMFEKHEDDLGDMERLQQAMALQEEQDIILL